MAITLPHDIVSGTLADATQVQANFVELESKATDKTGDTLTGTLNVQHLLPVTDDTYDIGSASKQVRDIYVAGEIIGPSANNAFSTIAVSGQSSVVADSTTDTLTLAAGTGITITTNASTDTITITSAGATQAGTSAVNFKSGGSLYNTQTQAGNTGTGEDTLWSQAIAANVLSSDGAALTFRANGTFASNTNVKRIRAKYGSTTILDMGAEDAPNGLSWVLSGSIIRSASTTQIVEAQLIVGTFSGQYTGSTTASETLSGAVTFTITAEATSNNDIVFRAGRIDYSPASGN